jgi:hypothetical protein
MTIRNNFDNFRNSDSDTIVVSKLSRKQNAVRVIHFGRFWRKLLGFIFWRSMQPKGWPPVISVILRLINHSRLMFA